MNTDKETSKVISDADELRAMVKGRGWEIIKAKLSKKIADLSNILEFDERDPQILMTHIAANQQAVKILIDWIQEIEGDIRNAENFKKVNREITESYIEHHLG